MPTETSQNYRSYGLIWFFIIIWICYARRKKAIGGWLLFYLIQLYLASFFSIFIIAGTIASYKTVEWESIYLFLLYLLTTVPQILLLFCQVGLTFWMIPKHKRDWKIIQILKFILLLDLTFSILSVIADFIYWPETLFFSIIGLIWTAIWLPYYYLSKRVRSIYQSKDWEAMQIPEVSTIKKPIYQQSENIENRGFANKVSSDIGLASARISIGNALLKKGEYEDAEKEYLGAIRLVPKQVEAYYGLASCYALRDMKKEALDNLRLAIENGYNDWPAMQEDKNLGNIREDSWFKILAEVVKKRWEIIP